MPGWGECERIGNLLAEESLRIVSAASWQREPKLRSWSKEVRFPVDNDDLWAVVTMSPLQYPHGADRTITVRMNLVNLGTAQMLTVDGGRMDYIGHG